MAEQTTFAFGNAGAHKRKRGKRAAPTTPGYDEPATPRFTTRAKPRSAAKAAATANPSSATHASFALTTETSRVLTGDSLAIAQQLAPGTVDCIYIDPPFGTGKVRVGRGTSYQDVDGDPASFVAWLSPWLQQSHRVLAAHGSLFVHLDYRTVHYIKVELDRIFGGRNFINEIIWCYAVGGKGARCFGKKHDTILWYGRSDAWTFYPDQIRVARRGGSHMKVVRDQRGQLVQQKVDRKTGRIYNYPVDAGKIPEDWWTDIEVLNQSAFERVGWPSQKPERLLQRIIAAVTKPGDLVVDWFAGSGTTAAVAKRLARRYLVVDREPAATALIERRLQPTLNQPTKTRRTPRANTPTAKAQTANAQTAKVPGKVRSSSKKTSATKTKRSR